MTHEPIIKPESVALMQALLARTDIVAAANAAFRRAYPEVPQAMIDTAVFHVASEGIEATVDWLAEIERFLRDPSKELSYSDLWHVIYHLYNWQQFRALLPKVPHDLKESLASVRQLIEEGDKDAALHELELLTRQIDGDVKHPEMD